jgi:7-keto-8-aminopelargonate synthetase-like enzyme
MSDSQRWRMDSAPAPLTLLNGHEYLYFGGTGYLGLQAHPAVIAALQTAAAKYGLHTATSRLGFGGSKPVDDVERLAAQLLGAEDAVYLAGGYAGGQTIAAALAPAVSLLLWDESAHDALREALPSFAQLRRPPIAFRHRDADHATDLLAAHARPGERILLVTDGVVPVTGRLAPLENYLSLLSRYDGAMLLVDDAHGLATIGREGRGALELAGVAPSVVNRDLEESVLGPVRVFHTTTLSKAVGGVGGVIAGSNAFVDRLRRQSGWYRGATPPATPLAAATAQALQIVLSEPSLRQRLAANAKQLRAGLGSMGVATQDEPTPVVGLTLGSSQRMLVIQERLLAEGMAIAYFRDYTGAGAEGVLRIAVFANHTPEMIARLIAALSRVIE